MSVIDRVQKLLALSQSDNPHEAASALAAAQALIRKHQLSIDEVERETGQVQEAPESYRLDPIMSGKRHPKWKERLLVILARASGCAPFVTGEKFAEKHLYIVGRPSDADIVKYLFSYATAEIVRMSQKQCKGKGARYRDDWLHGAVTGIGLNLKGPESGATCHALAVIDNRYDAARKLASNLYDVNKSKTVKKVFSDRRAAEAGVMAGRLVDVSRNARFEDQGRKILP